MILVDGSMNTKDNPKPPKQQKLEQLGFEGHVLWKMTPPLLCPRFYTTATRRVMVGAVDRNVGVVSSKTHGGIWKNKQTKQIIR